MGLNSPPPTPSDSFISLNMASDTVSVIRCQMSMILLWRSPSVMAPCWRWFSTSSTSLRARFTSSVLLPGMRMSSTPIEMPARVATVKPRALTMSRISTVRSSPYVTKQ